MRGETWTGPGQASRTRIACRHMDSDVKPGLSKAVQHEKRFRLVFVCIVVQHTTDTVSARMPLPPCGPMHQHLQ